MTENRQGKPALRRALLEERNAAPAELRRQWDSAIRLRFAEWQKRHPLVALGVYWPMRGEPDLRDLYAELSGRGVALALPVTAVKNAPLRFAAWEPGDALVEDAMGVSVPAKSETLLRPEALLIPCVGFNAANVRLGYGGGFYDRTLALSPRPVSIGIAYECARVEFVSEPHDIPLDWIITERSIHEIRR